MAGDELLPGVASIDYRRDPIHDIGVESDQSASLRPVTAGLDIRALWEAARLAHVAQLSLAAAVCDRRDWGVAADAHLHGFMHQEPSGQGWHWTCAMEAGLRAIHLAWSFVTLNTVSMMAADSRRFWRESIATHLDFIRSHLEETELVPGNHLIAGLTGLAYTGMLLPELMPSTQRARLLHRLGDEIVRQTDTDGFSFESSTSYHRLVCELGLLVQAAARRQGTSLRGTAVDRLWKMAALVDAWRLDDGLLPTVGDDDSSAAITLMPVDPRRGTLVTALRDVLDARAVADPAARLIAGPSRDGASRLRRPEAVRGAGGLAVLHAPGANAILWAGGRGQHGLGGHAHNDALSVEIVLADERIVVDPGCPTYLHDPKLRDHFRSTIAHPTLRVDGAEQAPIPEGRPFLLPAGGETQLIAVSETRAVGQYRPLHRRWTHHREVGVAAREVRVIDRLDGQGEHELELRWPLALSEATLERGRLKIEALSIYAKTQPPPLEQQIEQTRWSPGYGRELPGVCWVVRWRATLPWRCETVWFINGGGSGGC